MLDKMTLAEFQKHLHTTFRAETGPGGSQDLALIEATALPSRQGQGRVEPFSLIFRGPMSPGLEQKIHQLAHAEMGAIEIFLVPIGTEGDPEGTHYQAIFN